MAGSRDSEAEPHMVKALIEDTTAEERIIVSAASDSEKKAQNTCSLIAGEVNRFGCVSHLLDLAVKRL